MKNISTYINKNNSINEGLALGNDKLELIEKFLNDKDRLEFNNKIVCNLFSSEYSNNINSDIIVDIAGYLVEAYVWNEFSKMITKKVFIDIFGGDEKIQLSPLTRRNTKSSDGSAIYWDFDIKGIDEKFEIKARSTKDGKKSGGYRFTVNQKNDKNLIYILVEYSISGDEIEIGNIKVTRKL